MFLLFLCLCCVSCYSVRIVSTKGTLNPDPFSTRDDYYRNYKVVEVDTIVKSSLFTDNIGIRTAVSGCESGKLHTVEYRNTLGGSLLYLITFGAKRKVKLKYVCMKKEN